MTSAEQPSGETGGPQAAGHPGAERGTAFGSGFLLQREIGVGGMGTVWRGWALGDERPVAIKILHPHLSGDPTVVGRFLREGDVLKRLDHPNLVKVHDLVVEGGRLGLVMDLVEGGDLHGRRKRHGTLPPAEVARIGAQAAGALAAAHALGVAHLDLKPANILISAPARPEAATAPDDATRELERVQERLQERVEEQAQAQEWAHADGPDTIDVRLTDFGISRIVDAADQATTTTRFGTPAYMSPETALTGAAGPASDLYALGITLYEILVGRTPHGGGQPLAVLARHVERIPRRLPSTPDPLWEVIAACTALEPADRPDAAAVAELLAAAGPALAGLPAAEPLPTETDFQITSELRPGGARSTSAAVPWPPPAAYQLPQVAGGEGDTAGDEVFAAAVLKAPPEGPFPTAAPRPEPREHRRVHVPTLSATTRRRAALVGAPLLLFGAVGASLLASGAIGGSHQSRDAGSPSGMGTPGPGELTGLGGASATGPGSGVSAAPGSASPGHGIGGDTNVGGSLSTPTAPAGTTGGGSGGGSTTPAKSTTTSPAAATDTGWVCRVGGFKVNGALSENPCIRDDKGTLMLKGELKGTYASSVVVVVRVDYGGTLSAANVSKAVTPSSLGGKTFVYEVTLGPWPAGEQITCQENVDLAASPKDYQYTSNSGDIRTS